MRKLLATVLAMALALLTLAACGNAGDGGGYGYTSSPILLGQKYFNVNEPEISIVFNQDGTFAFEDGYGISTGGYTIDEGIVTIVFHAGEGGEPEDSWFEIVTFDVLEEMHGTIFTIEGNLSEFAGEGDGTTRATQGGPAGETGNSPTVEIDGRDLTSALSLRTVGGVVYAEGKSFVESLTAADYQEFVYEFDAGEDTIYIISWATDVPIYKLYIGSATASQLVDDFEGTFADISIAAAPLLQGGEVYLPVEAFADLTGHSASFD